MQRDFVKRHAPCTSGHGPISIVSFASSTGSVNPRRRKPKTIVMRYLIVHVALHRFVADKKSSRLDRFQMLASLLLIAMIVYLHMK